jgi:hypothetical protein
MVGFYLLITALVALLYNGRLDIFSWAWWWIPVTPSLGSLRQED